MLAVPLRTIAKTLADDLNTFPISYIGRFAIVTPSGKVSFTVASEEEAKKLAGPEDLVIVVPNEPVLPREALTLVISYEYDWLEEELANAPAPASANPTG